MKLILALDSGLSLVLLGHSIVSLQILKDIVCRMALGGRLGGSSQAGRENGEQTKVFIKLVAFFFFVKKAIGEVSIGETRSRSFQKLSLRGVAMLPTVYARMEGTRRSGTPCPPPLSWHRLLLPIFCHLATSYTCISDFLLLQVGTHRVFTGLGWQQFITKQGF